MKKSYLPLFAGMLLVFFTVGCEALQEAWEEAMDPDVEVTENPLSPDFRRKYVVHLNSIVRYPRAGDLEREIAGLDGKTVWINTNQLFSSKNIREARALPRPGNPDLYDLQFKVDRFGRLQWQLMAGNHSSDPVALVVDGVYFGSFYPELPEDENSFWVTLRVGINPITAKGIASNAKKNYKNLHPDSGNFFGD